MSEELWGNEMEPVPEYEIPENLKRLVLMVWVAALTAIIVTIIDWKIKTDILHLSQQINGRGRDETQAPRRPDPGRVRRVHGVDSDAGMEKGNVAKEVQVDPGEGEASWDEFPVRRGESVTGETRDLRPISEGTVFVPGSDKE